MEKTYLGVATIIYAYPLAEIWHLPFYKAKADDEALHMLDLQLKHMRW